MNKSALTVDIPNLPLARRGKVREVYDLGDYYLMVATDRISAFDCVFPNGVPGKGKILTQLSAYWFRQTESLLPNHVVSLAPERFLDPTIVDAADLRDRSMVVEKCEPIPIECVARGYLEGSSVKDYARDGAMGGVRLPPGLQRGSRLPEPIFSPATKAPDGEHDMNIGYDQVVDTVGAAVAERLRELTLRLYGFAHDRMAELGVVLADTKFEFGWRDGEIILIDEALTPDSSRYFDAATHGPGHSSRGFDKQYVRDWAETQNWDKTDPAPPLPSEVVANTARLYSTIFERIVGHAPTFL